MYTLVSKAGPEFAASSLPFLGIHPLLESTMDVEDRFGVARLHERFEHTGLGIVDSAGDLLYAVTRSLVPEKILFRILGTAVELE